MSEFRRGFGLHIAFIDHLHDAELQAYYSAVANLHNSQITTASSMSFPVCCVFTSRSLGTASNSEDSSASRPQVPFERRLPSNCLFSL
jgi:hypothetical protein